jgi:hypothetical protein
MKMRCITGSAPWVKTASSNFGGPNFPAALLDTAIGSFAIPIRLVVSKDDRWLAQMTRCVFQAGFVWRVIDHKWDDFEDVFFGFSPHKIVMLSPRVPVLHWRSTGASSRTLPGVAEFLRVAEVQQAERLGPQLDGKIAGLVPRIGMGHDLGIDEAA